MRTNWLRDVGEAAEELGYGIVRLEPGEIELVRGSSEITIRSVFLSAQHLRELLRPRENPPLPGPFDEAVP